MHLASGSARSNLVPRVLTLLLWPRFNYPGRGEFPRSSGDHTAPSCKQPACPRWAVGQPELRTGPHCTSSPLQGTSRPSRLRPRFKWLISCGYNPFDTLLKAVFVHRALDSGVLTPSGTTRWGATSTSTFWNSRHPWPEPAGQLRLIQCCCSEKDCPKKSS